jgi:hypothetical protein
MRNGRTAWLLIAATGLISLVVAIVINGSEGLASSPRPESSVRPSAHLASSVHQAPPRVVKWAAASIPNFDPNSAIVNNSMACGAPTRCLVVSTTPAPGGGYTPGAPYVARTLDGETWIQLNASGLTNSTRFSSLACPTARRCYVLGQDPNGSTSLLMTNDGGNSWNSKIGTSPSPLASPFASGSATALACSTEAICLAIGLQDHVLVGTTDGTAWTQHSPPWGVSAGVVSAGCIHSGDCYVLVYDANQQPPFSLWWTGDGGASFSSHAAVTGSPVSSVASSNPGFFSGIGSASCGDRTHCLVVTEGGTSAFSTTDAGRSWSTVALPAAAGAVTCQSATNCYLTTSQAATGQFTSLGIEGTTDGGRNWTLQEIPSGLVAYAPQCFTATKCFAVARQDQGTGNDTILAAETGTSSISDGVDGSGIPKTLEQDLGLTPRLIAHSWCSSTRRGSRENRGARMQVRRR